jgi:hypothetical protein
MSVKLAEHGAEAEAATRARLAASYEQFMSTEDPVRKDEAGQQLFQAIFGDLACPPLTTDDGASDLPR